MIRNFTILVIFILCSHLALAQIIPNGVNKGDMLYWNGANWVILPAGKENQIMSIRNGIPTWVSNDIGIITIVNHSKITKWVFHNYFYAGDGSNPAKFCEFSSSFSIPPGKSGSLGVKNGSVMYYDIQNSNHCNRANNRATFSDCPVTITLAE